MDFARVLLSMDSAFSHLVCIDICYYYCEVLDFAKVLQSVDSAFSHLVRIDI